METDKIFAELKSILAKYEPGLLVLHDKTDNYYLNIPTTEKSKTPEFFGAVQVKKSYVAFHLMPVYYYPELLANISQDLKSKMQGKSCFNFKHTDEKLFTELNSLTETAFKKYKSLKKV